jgi:hypothetical protein
MQALAFVRPPKQQRARVRDGKPPKISRDRPGLTRMTVQVPIDQWYRLWKLARLAGVPMTRYIAQHLTMGPMPEIMLDLRNRPSYDGLV